MFRPIAEPAYITHEISYPGRLMVRHEVRDGSVEIESADDANHDNDDADQPVKKRGALHNEVIAGKTGCEQ